MKPFIDLNTELRIKAENNFEKDFLNLMTNLVFGKTMGYVRKHREIKLVTTGGRKMHLVLEPNYHATNRFSENLLAMKCMS